MQLPLYNYSIGSKDSLIMFGYTKDLNIYGCNWGNPLCDGAMMVLLGKIAEGPSIKPLTYRRYFKYCGLMRFFDSPMSAFIISTGKYWCIDKHLTLGAV